MLKISNTRRGMLKISNTGTVMETSYPNSHEQNFSMPTKSKEQRDQRKGPWRNYAAHHLFSVL
jgi:hypothetical protein